MAMERKKSLGRQKVEMKKMSNESNLQVTFSKRRTGLFKKGSEICTLCGVEVALIVFSPGKKVFTFGHPSVETIIDRFLYDSPPQQPSGAMQLLEAHRSANVQEMNQHLTQVLGQLEREKARGETLTKMMKARAEKCWWERPVEKLNEPQLKQLKKGLEELKKNVIKQMDKIIVQPTTKPPHFCPGSCSHGGASSGGVGGLNGASGANGAMWNHFGNQAWDVTGAYVNPHGYGSRF